MASFGLKPTGPGTTYGCAPVAACLNGTGVDSELEPP